MSKEVMAKLEVARALTKACKKKTSKRITVPDSMKILELLPEVIIELMEQDMIVRIPGLISFEPVVVNERIAKNPQNGEVITCPPTRLVKVKKSRAFADKIKVNYAEQIANLED